MTRVKYCTGCAKDLPRSDFYHRSNGKIANRCRVCDLRRRHVQYSANRDEERCRYRQWYRANRDRVRAEQALRQKPRVDNRSYDVKEQARARLHAAVASGLVVKPTACSECQCSTRRIEAHHEDYAKPIDVIWLCSRCHGLRHVKYRNEAA